MTATTRLGVRVLELPGLKGISLDNYECKLEQRSKKKCNKNNQMEASKLNRTLKVNEKCKDMFTHNLRSSEEVFAKKLMNIRMQWHEWHPPTQSNRQSIPLKATENKKRDVHNKKLPRRLSPLITQRKPALLSVPGQADEKHQATFSRRGSDESDSSGEVVDEQLREFFGLKWYNSRDGTKVSKFNRKIPLTFKQQMFLAKLEGLLDPRTPSIAQPEEPTINRRSRLWVKLPMAMDGGKLGQQVRKNSYKFKEDAPILEIAPDKLKLSKKPDTIETWSGLEQEDIYEREVEKIQKAFPQIKITENNY